MEFSYNLILVVILRKLNVVRHFEHSRSSGLAPGRVDYFDDVTVFIKQSGKVPHKVL